MDRSSYALCQEQTFSAPRTCLVQASPKLDWHSSLHGISTGTVPDTTHGIGRQASFNPCLEP